MTKRSFSPDARVRRNAQHAGMAALITPILGLLCAGNGAASTVTTSASTMTSDQYAAATYTYITRADSSVLAYTSYDDINLESDLYILSIPGVSLPTGAAITSATLTWDMPNVSQLGVANTIEWEPLTDHGFQFPTLVSESTLYTLPLSLSAGGVQYTFRSLDFGSRDTVDLLALGFGSQVAAGDSFTFQAYSNEDAIYAEIGLGECIGGAYCDDMLPHGGTNISAKYRLYVGFQDLPVTATLAVSYDLAPGSVPEPASWALTLGGLGLVGGALRRRRSAAVPVG